MSALPSVSNFDQLKAFNHCDQCHQPLAEKVKTACGHFFHVDCLSTWITQQKQNCPLCRAKVGQFSLPEDKELLPVKKDNPENQTDCAICLESLNETVDQAVIRSFYRTKAGENVHPACFSKICPAPVHQIHRVLPFPQGTVETVSNNTDLFEKIALVGYYGAVLSGVTGNLLLIIGILCASEHLVAISLCLFGVVIACLLLQCISYAICTFYYSVNPL
jgi:hypothetical protein